MLSGAQLGSETRGCQASAVEAGCWHRKGLQTSLPCILRFTGQESEAQRGCTPAPSSLLPPGFQVALWPEPGSSGMFLPPRGSSDPEGNVSRVDSKLTSVQSCSKSP